MSPVDSCGRRALRGDGVLGGSGLRQHCGVPSAGASPSPSAVGAWGAAGKGAAPLPIGSRRASAVLLPRKEQTLSPRCMVPQCCGLKLEFPQKGC